MEFTTHLGLYSQTVRLGEAKPLVVVLLLFYGALTLYGAPFQGS